MKRYLSDLDSTMGMFVLSVFVACGILMAWGFLCLVDVCPFMETVRAVCASVLFLVMMMTSIGCVADLRDMWNRRV